MQASKIPVSRPNRGDLYPDLNFELDLTDNFLNAKVRAVDAESYRWREIGRACSEDCYGKTTTAASQCDLLTFPPLSRKVIMNIPAVLMKVKHMAPFCDLL